MARHEGPREDLLAEAVALVERVELVLASGEPVVVGFRRDGCASFFFDQDPVYQFNTRCELRRLYVDGLRYKAEQGRLVGLEVRRDAGEVQMLREELTAERADAMLAEAERRLSELAAALRGGKAERRRQVPEQADVPARVLAWLESLGRPLIVAESPHAR